MSRARRFLVPLLASVSVGALAACWSPGVGSAAPDTNKGRGTAAYVFEDDELVASDGTLLSALVNRISNMSVLRGQNSECPAIQLRGRTTVARVTSPGVYVDGARATNTCVLENLPVAEVHRVEVYPMGLAHHAGYEAQPGGLILVFMRTAR
ncbi:MAG TPA: TonB-dependent receptor plug domain-containing protein [Longimicrobiaceae bacterium]|nr:TonB-dependent receptor plug domain-containing protein [Longimicrobiaceae bacterium]